MNIKQKLKELRQKITGNDPMVEGWLWMALAGITALIILYYGIKELVA